jgi:urea carboxylase
MRWKEAGLDSFAPFEQPASSPTDLPPGCIGVEIPVPGSLWKFPTAPGARVMAGDTVAIIESTKMEIAVTTPISGRLRSVNTSPGRTVRAGEILALMESE